HPPFPWGEPGLPHPVHTVPEAIVFPTHDRISPGNIRPRAAVRRCTGPLEPRRLVVERSDSMYNWWRIGILLVVLGVLPLGCGNGSAGDDAGATSPSGDR